MASVRKVGDKWRAEVRCKGIYKSKRFQTKLEADNWAFDLEKEIGANNYQDGGYTLYEAMQRYSVEISPSRKGARWEVVRLKKLMRQPLANVLLSNLTSDIINDWIEGQSTKLGASSIHRELSLIASVVKVSRTKWKWHSNEPMKDVEKPKKPPPRDRRISEDETTLILSELGYYEGKPINRASDEVAVGFLLALETGMRQGEIWGIEGQYIYLHQRYITLPETKNGTKRDVPLSARAVELVKMLNPPQTGKLFSYSQDSAGTLFRKAVKRAGIVNLTFHDSRHEAITRLARKVDVLDLARMVGHNDLQSLRVYYNATASEIAKRLDS